MNFETSLPVGKVKEQMEHLPINVNSDVCILEYENAKIIVMSVSLVADAELLQHSNYTQILFTEQERLRQIINKETPINISGNVKMYQ